MKKFLLFLTCVLTLFGVARAEETIVQDCTFNKNGFSAGTSSYTSGSCNFTNNDGFVLALTNCNNSSKAWDYVKIGQKSNTSNTATISTTSALDDISKIEVNVQKLVASATIAVTLKTGTTSSSSAFNTTINTITVSGNTEQDITFTLPNPAANLYYKLEFFSNNSTSTNGALQVNGIKFYKDSSPTITPDQPSNPGTGASKTATYVVADQKYSNSQVVTEYKTDDITFSFSKGRGSNDPAYYTSGASLRLYANNTLTISAPENCQITEIEFGLGSTKTDLEPDCGNGTINSNNTKWVTSGSPTNKVVFTKQSGQIYIQTITVTYIVPLRPYNQLNDLEPITLPFNGTKQLDLGTSHPTISYSFKPEGVVSISKDGLITALNAGNTTVTASWNAEDEWNEGSAEFNVKVTEAETYNPPFAEEVYTYDMGQSDMINLGEDHPSITFTDPNGVVSIDAEGKVTTLKGGETEVKATWEEEGKWKGGSATFTVKVNKFAYNPEFAYKEYPFTIGDTDAEIPLKDPHPTLSFEYLEGDIITINPETGAVTIHKAGEEYVTVTWEGDDSWEGGEALFTVTVNRKIYSFSETSKLSMYVGDTKALYEGEDHPEFEVDILQDDDVISVTGNEVTALKEGEALIFISWDEDDYFKAGSADFTVTVTEKPFITEITWNSFDLTDGGNSYKDYTLCFPEGTTEATADIVYKVNLAISSNALQFRSGTTSAGTPHSGLVVSKNTKYRVKSINIDWDLTQTTAVDREFNVHTNDKALTHADDLYSSNTKIGSIKKAETSYSDFEGDVKYIGLRSNNGALYLKKIAIEWELIPEEFYLVGEMTAGNNGKLTENNPSFKFLKDAEDEGVYYLEVASMKQDETFVIKSTYGTVFYNQYADAINLDDPKAPLGDDGREVYLQNEEGYKMSFDKNYINTVFKFIPAGNTLYISGTANNGEDLKLTLGNDKTMQDGTITDNTISITTANPNKGALVYVYAPEGVVAVYFKVTPDTPQSAKRMEAPNLTDYKQAVENPFDKDAYSLPLAEGSGTVSLYYQKENGDYSNEKTFTYTVKTGVTTGVDGIEADDEAEYFTLQGIKVQNPEKGIYIKVQNGKTSKVVL